MEPLVADVLSETGWDALTDGHPMVVRALEGPCTLEEIALAAGERDLALVGRRLARLVREGILVRNGDHYRAAARMIQTFRQEGLISSLSRHVMPIITRLAHEPESGFAIVLDVKLDEEEQAALRSGAIKDLIDELNQLSEAPAPERTPRTLVVLGTSDVPPPGPRGDRLLEIFKRTARQRSEQERAPRAVLTCYDARFGDPEAAAALVRSFAARIEARGSSPSATPYTLVFGFGAKVQMDGELQ